jgi:hypothetical protein
MPSERSLERLTHLSSQLRARTDSGHLKWLDIGGGAGFELKTPSASIVIETIDKDNAPPYRLSIRNEEGTEVEALEQEWYPDEDGTRTSAWWNRELTNLFETARRSAYDIDSLLDVVFDELNIPREPPPPPPF